MKNYLILLLLSLSILLSQQSMAQHNNSQLPTSINAAGTAPDSSAILDIQSTTQGMLVPRMTSAQRTAISNAATGLLIYQTDNTPGFYYYDGSSWVAIGSGGIPDAISDANNDTKIQVEENLNEDLIRFDLGGVEHFVMDGAHLEVKNSDGSVYFGDDAGVNDSNGSNNTFIGGLSDASSDNLTNATAIGYNANVAASNSLVLGNGVNVGIGTSTPANALDVEASTTGAEGIIRAEYVGTSSTDQQAIHGNNSVNDYYGRGVYGKGGWQGVYGTVTATGTSAYVGVIGDVSGGTGSNYAIYGTVSGGTTSYAGYFNGDVNVIGTFTNPSDAKLKQNVQTMDNAILDKINKLEAKQYHYTNAFKSMHLPKGKQLGFIAQDVEEVFPELVSANVHPNEYVDKNGKKVCDKIAYLGVNYIGLIPVLTKGVQELSATVADIKAKQIKDKVLSAEIAVLKAQNEVLEKRLLHLETVIEAGQH